MQELSINQQLGIVLNEIIERRVFVSIAFSIIAILMLLVGSYWPKVYQSSSSILWSNIDSVSPLLSQQSRGKTTSISEQAAIAREIILSNKILDSLVVKLGLDTDSNQRKLDGKELELLKANLIAHIEISKKGKKLITISYKNKDANLAYLVVSTISELFMKETRLVKNESSQGAFNFIDRQVMDYKNKLELINQHIIKFRKENADLDSDTSSGVNTRVNDLKTKIREANLELTESRVQKQSLEEQLAVEKAAIEKQLLASSFEVSSVERNNVNVGRLKSLQMNLDTLRLSYTENYPDIVQLKEQIKNLKEQILAEESRYPVVVDKEVADPNIKSIRFVESPLYTRLTNNISGVETTIKTLEARVIDAESRLADELLRANEVNAQESQLEEMALDLDVTQRIYNDLLTRRENARVSLNLQLENQGSSFKLQEPATIPLLPIGIRFLHFALGSIPVGLAFPLGIIIALLMVDQKIRHEDSVKLEGYDIPVIAVVGQYHNDAEKKMNRNRNMISISVVVFAFISMAFIATLKVSQIIGI